MSSSNLASAKALHEAFNNRDWNGARAVIAEDCVFVDGTGQRREGPVAFTDDYFKPWVDAFSDARRTEVQFYDAGDTVVIELVGRGTQDGAFGPIAATGKAVEMPYCEVFHFDAESKVSSGHAYFDPGGLMAQLGEPGVAVA
jgi:steroid delta-isomerase-like uncharacterized protein